MVNKRSNHFRSMTITRCFHPLIRLYCLIKFNKNIQYATRPKFLNHFSVNRAFSYKFFSWNCMKFVSVIIKVRFSMVGHDLKIIVVPLRINLDFAKSLLNTLNHLDWIFNKKFLSVFYIWKNKLSKQALVHIICKERWWNCAIWTVFNALLSVIPPWVKIFVNII